MRTKLKHILKIITSKTFLGAFAFSLSLWLYITLNTEFVSFVKLPLKIQLPADKSIDEEIPKHISVEVRASGWQIFNLDFLNTAAECRIDLSRRKIEDSVFVINRTDIIKNLENLGNVQAIDVVPQSLVLSLGKIGEYSVVVEPDVEIIPAENYLTVGDIKTVPDLITIRGCDKKIRGITRWKTIHKVYEDVRYPIEDKIPLSDTLSNIIELSKRQVVLKADVQKLAEITIEDIPLQYTGADLPPTHRLTPLLFDITLRGGLREIERLNIDEISVSVNTAYVVNDTTGVIQPLIKVPDNIEVIQLYPPYLYHSVRMNKIPLNTGY